MTDIDLTTEWAWSQVEAMADGSLRGADRQRMRRAMRRDARVRAAVERARSVRRSLRLRDMTPVPPGLGGRLLSIPPGSARTSHPWRWAAVPAIGAAAAVALLLLQPAPPPVDTRTVAMQEFRTAMSYLQRSAAVTGAGVTRELRNGFSEALSVSRDAINDESDFENGG